MIGLTMLLDPGAWPGALFPGRNGTGTGAEPRVAQFLPGKISIFEDTKWLVVSIYGYYVVSIWIWADQSARASKTNP